MDLLAQALDLVLHLDRHLAVLVAQYGPWIYAILFAIVFAETGFVVTPFLPGDSLLFVAGALAATGGMDLGALILTLTLAAVLDHPKKDTQCAGTKPAEDWRCDSSTR